MKVKIKGIPKAAQGAELPNFTNPILDLSVEDNAIRPLSPSFSVLGGASHSEGGTMIAHGDNVVEAQRGEPVSKNSQGSVVAWGKMTNPYTGKSFESDAKSLADSENKITKKADKGTQLINDYDSFHPLDALKFNSGVVFQDASAIEQNQLNSTKEDYSNTQQTILNLANAFGVDPKKFADKIHKNGTDLKQSTVKVKIKGVPTAQNGKNIEYRNPNRPVTYTDQNAAILNPDWTTLIGQGNAIVPDPERTNYSIYTTQPVNTGIGTFGDVGEGDVWAFNNLYNPLLGRDVSTKNASDVRKFQQQHIAGINQFNQRFPDSQVPQYFGAPGFSAVDGAFGGKTANAPVPSVPAVMTQQQYDDAKAKGLIHDDGGQSYIYPKDISTLGNIPNTYSDGINVYQPYVKPTVVDAQPLATHSFSASIVPNAPPVATPLTNSPTTSISPQGTRAQTAAQQPPKQLPSLADRNRLSPFEFIPEIAAILDRPDYVQGFEYRPQLNSPYQVTFQDRINQNHASFNQAIHTVKDNPEALAALAGQLRQADDSVRSQEFQANQQISNTVNNQNIGMINQANMTNLQLAQEQATKQEQARANTEAARRAALNSISQKVLQNKAENNAIRLLENYSKYRVDDKMNAQYMGNPAYYNYNQYGNNPYPYTLVEGVPKISAYGRTFNNQQEVQEYEKKMAEAQKAAKARFGRLL